MSYINKTIYVGSNKYALYIGAARKRIKKKLPYDAEVEYLRNTGLT